MNTSRPLALVTGARRGIGAGIAIELASRGFDIALTDIDAAGAEPTLAAIEAHGARCKLFESDLGHVEQHAAVVERIVEWHGPIACLVNNAGIPAPSRGDLLDVTPATFDRVLDVNLRGTFFFTQAVARHMAATPSERARAIVTVSSVSVEMASIERGEYCVSKSGLGMLTKLFALRLAPLGIGVFEVRPGVIRTPMTEGVAGKYEQRIADGLVPMGRWGYPEDVARAVAALAGGELGFSTGSVIHVDGALSIPTL
ncbi:3-ketoacyl-ACP reductase [Variovorax sp. J22R133]|uniref:3-ketoacyl-ACP reductase n=1 Tax=Variovorax brevis TaxID=3053503 RepID=UPI0025749589|nr:3-ketoacyl-ACP reductase [Variovorax sp. J22R133]MDM0111224.1 3-ketoacyl-ACP reductase [Variovorax sp. J22R133]